MPALRALKPGEPVLLDRAAHLLDAASVDGASWDDLRDDLAACYAEAGLAGIARFVRG